jgi:hypothetical protein
MKRNSGLFFTVIIISSLILSSCGKPPKEILTEYEQAYNKHDISKIMSFYSDNVVLDLSILSKLKGKEALRNYAKYDSVMNTQIKISDIATSDDNTMFVMSLTNDLYKTIGIDTAKYSMIFTIEGGRITKMSGSTTRETDKNIQDFSKNFMLWASKEKLDELNQMMPNGRLNYNAVNAKKYINMVLEYKMSHKDVTIKEQDDNKKVNPHW